MKENLKRIFYVIFAISIILNVKYYLDKNELKENYINYTTVAVSNLKMTIGAIKHIAQEDLNNGTNSDLGSIIMEVETDARIADLFRDLVGIKIPKLTYQESQKMHLTGMSFRELYIDVRSDVFSVKRDSKKLIELCEKYEKALYNYAQKLSKNDIFQDDMLEITPNYDLSMSELKKYWKEFYLEAGEIYCWSNPQYWRR